MKKYQLPLETEIDVFAFRGDEIKKVTMTYGKWLNLRKKKGWRYDAYEKGFCSIKPN